MKSNKPARAPRTHEGAPAIPNPKPYSALRRAVGACLLWEDSFYEDGQSIADRIAALVPQCSVQQVSALAIDARMKLNLRHAPLYLVALMHEHKQFRIALRQAAGLVISRADEPAELLSLVWRNGRTKLAAQLKRGIADAFQKFDEYQLAKYDRSDKIKLRDVLRIVHPKPRDEAQSALWARLMKGELATPDTWEVALSAGKDKRETFERLMRENKLGGLALLRNLRNMQQAGVSQVIVEAALRSSKFKGVLPFQFVTAARYAPWIEPVVEEAMLRAAGEIPKLEGTTVLLVDVSGSMNEVLSKKGETTRIDAASGLAILAREACESVRVLTFSETTTEVPARRGFALRDAIEQSQPHTGTDLGGAIRYVAAKIPNAARVIVITDEQSRTVVGAPPAARGYMVNVSTEEHAVGYGPWTRVDGFSASIIDYIVDAERAAADAHVSKD